MRARHRFQVSFNHKESDAELIDFLYGASQETKRSIIRAGYALLFGNKESQSARAASVDPEMMNVILAAMSGIPHQPGAAHPPHQPYSLQPYPPQSYPPHQPGVPGSEGIVDQSGARYPDIPARQAPPQATNSYAPQEHPAERPASPQETPANASASVPQSMTGADPEKSGIGEARQEAAVAKGPSVAIRRPSALSPRPSAPAQDTEFSARGDSGTSAAAESADHSPAQSKERSLPEDDIPDPLSILGSFQ